MSERWKRNVLRAVIALAVIACVLVILRVSIFLVDTYWPKEKPLSFEQAFQLGQFIVVTLGLTSLLLMWKQSKDTARWNKLHSYHQFFADCPSSERRANMFAVMERIQASSHLSEGTAILAEHVQAIVLSPSDSQVIALYLDDFEQLCGAVNCGVIDAAYVKALEKSRINRIYTVFKPLLAHHQQRNSTLYLEFERLADKWIEEDRVEAEREEQRAKRAKHAGGVKNLAPHT
ncbi:MULTISPECIES: DUF4760 domain-containing protein [Stenotrophomonas]|uniref:DUF4760 domain-containing protein n=1 Tax=Stenotrophomonas maltophilia group TaxID=995085 RepID=UPI00088166D4|nr:MULTISPECIES: hypothetical protein [Stenotrophomonas]MCU1195881.1 hypothetical protein [Stenotrophomonas maltophilia]NGM54070.1 hypothetical protein [Stenotrophomonas pavanii]PZT12044.1 hypothetical protein A7X91_00040 [Stenotrophomonas maltophilia]QGL96097.1 hypothetical protein FEO90_04590 [Stenotrophomonas maltophilia]SDK81271.1 hypothetical protein SAMN04487784_3447 [Stenotrophomonas pavanii]